jgi:hypothetical protein
MALHTRTGLTQRHPVIFWLVYSADNLMKQNLQVIMTVSVNITVFYNLTQCSLEMGGNI